MIYFLHPVQRPGPSLIITPDKNIIAVLIYHLLTPPGTLHTTNINAITDLSFQTDTNWQLVWYNSMFYKSREFHKLKSDGDNLCSGPMFQLLFLIIL